MVPEAAGFAKFLELDINRADSGETVKYEEPDEVVTNDEDDAENTAESRENWGKTGDFLGDDPAEMEDERKQAEDSYKIPRFKGGGE